MEKERRKFCLSTMIKNSFLLPTKHILDNAASHLRHKAKEKSRGLVTLYEDLEACAEYADIQVMWEMIQSSCPKMQNNRSRKRLFYRKFCFQST